MHKTSSFQAIPILILIYKNMKVMGKKMSLMASLICVRFVFALRMQLLVINSVTFQCVALSTIADLTMRSIFCDVQVMLND